MLFTLLFSMLKVILFHLTSNMSLGLSKVYVVSNIIIIVCEINVFNSCTKCTYDSSNRRKNQSNVNKSGRLMMFCFTRGYTVMLLNQLTRTPAMFFSINAPYDEFITSPSLWIDNISRSSFIIELFYKKKPEQLLFKIGYSVL